jgi:DNA-binding winged-HTH domains
MSVPSATPRPGDDRPALPKSSVQRFINAEGAQVTREGSSIGTCLRFKGFEFDERRGELRRVDGSCVALRPRAESLLRIFLLEPGRLFGRDELTALLWPSTVVTDDSLVQCVGELRSALDDHGQDVIRTIRGRGYRWEPAVERCSDAGDRGNLHPPVLPPASQSPVQTVPESPSTKRLTRQSGIALAVLAIAAIGVAALQHGPLATVHVDEEMAARGTVAVMPFVAASPDAESRAVADLFADAVTSQFATRRGMRGLGRPSTVAYAGAPLDTVARDLKARLVVTGQVARAGKDRVAIDVQLISTRGGGIVWSRHMDADMDSASARAELGQHVVNAVRNRARSAETADASYWEGVPDAVRQTVLGWRDLDLGHTVDDARRARVRFEEALRVDPRSVIALNGLATSYAVELRDPHGALTPQQVARYEKLAESTRELAPDDPTALLVWGSMQIWRGRSDLAIPALEKSIRIVPSYPYSYVLLARAKLLTGHPEEVQALADQAIARGEGDPKRISAAYLVAAEAAVLLGDDARARSFAKNSIAELPSNADARAVLAAVDAISGEKDKAASELADLRKQRPDASLAGYALSRRSDNPTYLAQSARLYAGLREAGLR